MDPYLAQAQSDAAILDPWSALTHKRALYRPGDLQRLGLAGTWTGEHTRRLTAYRILAAYQRNVARATITADTEDARREYREYGDGHLLVAQALSALLGDESLVIAEHADEDEPSEPEPPDELADDATDQDRAAHAQRTLDYEDAHAQWVESLDLRREAIAFQEWLDWWLEREQFDLKLVETERNAVGMGDGLYLVSWSNKLNRPRLHVYDPGAYFPVLSDEMPTDYPDRVHLAWEYDETVNGETTRWLRRITLTLGPIRPLFDDEAGDFVRDETGALQFPQEGDRLTDDGRVERVLPWDDDDLDGQRATTTTTCYMTDAAWNISDLDGRKVDDLSDAKAVYALTDDGELLRDLDLGVDFIPLVHVPNTIALLDHYGTSLLTLVAQLLDDLASADTDLKVAADTTGAPPIAISKTGAPGDGKLDSYGPGSVFWTGDGNMSILDTSRSLDALLKYVDQLLKRLSTNSRLPEEVLGRVRMADVPSGIALALSFGPFQSLIRELRLARRDKYRLLFKMVQRFAMLGGASGIDARGALDPGPTHRVDLRFGSFLPSDTRTIVEMIVSLLGKHGLSRLTALRLMSEAGLNVGDWHDELDRIEREDFTGAGDLADATGRDRDAQQYLGLEVDEDTGPAFPTIADQPPGAPGGGGFPFGTPPPQPGEGAQPEPPEPPQEPAQ